MSDESISTRRSFLKGGAMLAAPLAAMGAPAAALAASADADERADRLARLEDEKAIRALHGDWMHRLSSGDRNGAARLYANDACAAAVAGIAAISPGPVGAQDALEIAADGRTARARHAATVETEAVIAPDNTLAQMLHAQGEGTVRSREARMLAADYVKTRDGGWAIAGLAFETV